MNVRHLYFVLLMTLFAASFPPSLAHAQSVATVGFYNNNSGYITYYPGDGGGTWARQSVIDSEPGWLHRHNCQSDSG